MIVDTDTLEFEAILNPSISAMGGAGVVSGQLMAEKQVEAVLTGNVGPNAFQTLQAAGIKVYTGISGTVKEAVEKCKKGEIKSTEGPTADPKAGM
jgi:predicted Fe-Mo cluster-binding NifX family protein